MNKGRALGAGLVICVALVASGTPAGDANPLTVGNILVSDEVTFSPGIIREMTPSGTLVQTFRYPLGGDFLPRDIAIDGNGHIVIYDGTFTPVLTTLNPTTGAVISSTPFVGWSTANNVTFGGVAAFGQYVFVTDMATFGGTPNGIIRFDINDHSGVRFGSGTANGPGDYIDVAIGLDGLLYAQYPGGSPSGNRIDVFDPLSMVLLRQISLGQDLRAITVDQDGHIFGVGFSDSRMFEFNSNGGLLRTVNTPVSGRFYDLDITPDGRILALAAPEPHGTVVLTDRSLAQFSTFDAGSQFGNVFGAFVQPPLGSHVPEPNTLSLLAVGVAGIACSAIRRCK